MSAFVVPFVHRTKLQRAREDLLQVAGAARFGDKIGSAERARMARITLVALSGEDHDAYPGCQLEQVGNQRKTLIGTVRYGWQAEVDQRQFRRSAQLSKQLQAMRTRMAGEHFEKRLSENSRCHRSAHRHQR
jgi:hypothetical protein